MRHAPSALLALALAAAVGLAPGCGEDPAIPPPAPPEPAVPAPATPAVHTGPLDATPGTAVHAFRTPSIHCEGCAETIRMKVGKVAGVRDVSVSVPEHTVWVRVDDAGPAVQTLAQTITEAGYEATPADAAPADAG